MFLQHNSKRKDLQDKNWKFETFFPIEKHCLTKYQCLINVLSFPNEMKISFSNLFMRKFDKIWKIFFWRELMKLSRERSYLGIFFSFSCHISFGCFDEYHKVTFKVNWRREKRFPLLWLLLCSFISADAWISRPKKLKGKLINWNETPSAPMNIIFQKPCFFVIILIMKAH